MHKTNCSQNSFLGGVYLVQKCQISIFIFDTLQAAHWWRPQRLRVTLDQKGHKTNCSQNSFLGGVYLMQKCQISIFISGPSLGSLFGEALEPQGDLRSKNVLRQKVQGGQFYAESPKSKICITPGVGSDQKIVYYKMLLEFDFRWGMFYVKMPNSQKIFFGWVPACLGSNISGPSPKFKIPLPRLFSTGLKVSKKVCYTSVG